MNRLIKKIVLSLFVIGLFLHPIEPAAALARRRIILYENETGPYYGVDMTQKEAEETEPASEESTEEIQTEEIKESEESEEPEKPDILVEFKGQNEEEKLEDPGFIYTEAIDEKTTIY